MNLWLDDIRDPKIFSPGKTWTWAMTYQEALDLILTKQVKFISLDHDLAEDKTGYDLANEIERMAYEGTLPPMKWAVHSANPIGSARIRQAMKSADKAWANHHSDIIS